MGGGGSSEGKEMQERHRKFLLRALLASPHSACVKIIVVFQVLRYSHSNLAVVFLVVILGERGEIRLASASGEATAVISPGIGTEGGRL